MFYQQNINEATRLAIWKIEESEDFFSATVPIQKNIAHPHKRLQHFAGRYLLRYLFPDFPYNDILIADTNKPYLAYEEYHFSISHCGDFAAAIVSNNTRVGIDVEIPSPKILGIRKKFLHSTEQLIFNDDEKLIEQSTLLWCAKEAIYKWWGLGGINFSEMIRIEPFVMKKSGEFFATFSYANEKISLQLRYLQFMNLQLVWLHNSNKLI